MSIFRPEYKELSEKEKAAVQNIKEQAEKLLDAIQHGYVLPEGEGCTDPERSREMSLAITKLEESVMWAVKHWTK